MAKGYRGASKTARGAFVKITPREKVMLKEHRAYEKRLILELKESSSKVLDFVEKLEAAADTSDEALDAYAGLMAQALQVKLDVEALLEVNDKLMKLELQTVG